MRDRRVLCLLLALSAIGCARRLTEDECRELLDRYAMLLIRGADPSLSSLEVDRLRLEAQRRFTTGPGREQCAVKVSRRAYRCAMSAGSTDAIERCLL